MIVIVTDVPAPHAELAPSAARRRTAVLLTDAVHSAGPDPRDVARRFGELPVLLETGRRARRPARRRPGPPRARPARADRPHRDVAPAVNRVLT
jgi:hypothetical protein